MMQQSSGQRSSLQPSRHVTPWHDFPGLVIGNLSNPIDLEPPIGWQRFTPAIEVKPSISADQLLGADMLIRQVPQFIQLRDVKLIGHPALLLPKDAGELDLQSQSANHLPEKTHQAHRLLSLASSHTEKREDRIKFMSKTTHNIAEEVKNSVSDVIGLRRQDCGNTYAYRTYSERMVTLWPPMGDPANQFTIRDIANNLAKINYHPEAAGAPFTAAQYACELAEILRNESPLFQLRALTANAHEAYGGHVPAVARKAERGIHPPALQSDRRDELETSLQNRVRQALCIPDLRGELNSYFTALCYARWTLDATLARDIGASIHPPREEMDEALQRLSEPLRRKITPMIWIKALERYLRTYTDLAILSGIPVKE